MYRQVEWPDMNPKFGYFGFRPEWTIAFVPSMNKDSSRYRIFWACWWQDGEFVFAGQTIKHWHCYLPGGEEIRLDSLRWFCYRCPSQNNSPFVENMSPPLVKEEEGVLAIKHDPVGLAAQRKLRRFSTIVYFIQGVQVPLIKIGVTNDAKFHYLANNPCFDTTG